MELLCNDTFKLMISSQGTMESLFIQQDPSKMNWVIDAQYVEEAGYRDQDKRFGHWSAVVDDEWIESAALETRLQIVEHQAAAVSFLHSKFAVQYEYLLNKAGELHWTIQCTNLQDSSITVTGFHSWFSLAYIMFRDTNVLRNMKHSCALFPHLGGDFSKFAAMRRSNEAPHLAIYSTGERVAAFGTHCSYENRFLEQVSPSLDGVLYHRLSFVEDGGSMGGAAANDWIYSGDYTPLILEPGAQKKWSFVFTPFQDQADFYKKAQDYGHPYWRYSPVITTEGKFLAEVTPPDQSYFTSITVQTASTSPQKVNEIDITNEFKPISEEKGKQLYAVLPLQSTGEFKILATLENGKTDVLIGNVLEPVSKILLKRAHWLCHNSYNSNLNSVRPHAFLPLSNQGESLGKLAFILMNNLLSSPIQEQIRKVELSAVLDMSQHWFMDGDLSKPRALYGSFYRIYDFDYIAHVYYLLSCFDNSQLGYADSDSYLIQAAQVMCMRLNPNCHVNVREKEESQLVGVFILYIADLLQDLKDKQLLNWYEPLQKLWLQFVKGLKQGAQGYQGAITEHFYDNAGFGPTSEALCLAGLKDEAALYAELLIANIGFSNDYRANAPDRWWEALSFMTHSLWGGLVSGAARSTYEALGNVDLLEAGYRSSMAIFNCYDWNVLSTKRRLKPGEAASTYSIAAPNLNMPELSRNRFGQSIFKKSNDPLFHRLFADIESDDWDMGEELVAYMLGFGRTTYLYRDQDGELRCVNGYLESLDTGWKITSYAAYPSKFVMLENELTYVTEGEITKSVYYIDGRFQPIP